MVCACLVYLAVAGGEGLVRAFVRLGQFRVDREGKLVTAVVHEGAGHAVLRFALGCASADVACAVFLHRSDHATALRVEHVGLVGGHERGRGLVGHLQLSLLLVQVPDGLPRVSLVVYVVGAVGGLQAAIVFVLQQFVFDSDAVLARDACDVLVLRQVLLDVRLQELVRSHITHVLEVLFSFGLRRHQVLGLGALVLDCVSDDCTVFWADHLGRHFRSNGHSGVGVIVAADCVVLIARVAHASVLNGLRPVLVAETVSRRPHLVLAGARSLRSVSVHEECQSRPNKI